MQHGIAVEAQVSESLPASLTLTLLNLFEGPLLVANTSGALLLVNERARQALDLPEDAGWRRSNLFGDILRMDPQVLLGQIESGESEVDRRAEGSHRAIEEPGRSTRTSVGNSSVEPSRLCDQAGGAGRSDDRNCRRARARPRA